MIRASILIAALLLAGCGMPTAVTPASVYIQKHAGTVGQADDLLYDGLLTARAALVTAKGEISQYPGLQALLNTKVIPPFNALEVSYLAYHNALVAGQTADASPIQQQLVAATAALATALATVGAKQ